MRELYYGGPREPGEKRRGIRSFVGTFRSTIHVENVARRNRSAAVHGALVDTGSGYTWVPQDVLEGIGVKREKKDLAFVMADGKTITRSVGFAVVRVGAEFTVDEVVFGEPGDLRLLGARTLEGLNLTVDARRKRLVAGGPLPAAGGAAASRRHSAR
jgi:predicted aspartyl protease